MPALLFVENVTWLAQAEICLCGCLRLGECLWQRLALCVCVCSWWVGVCVEWKNGGNDDTNRAEWWEAGVRALLLLAGWMQYLTAD